MSILLTILKVIGIVLLVLLCIFILLVSCILFVPIHYQAYVKLDETLHGKVRCSYLLHIVTVFFGYDDGKQSGKIKVFGITVRDFFPSEKKKKQLEEKEKRKEAKRVKKEQILEKKKEAKRKKQAKRKKSTPNQKQTAAAKTNSVAVNNKVITKEITLQERKKVEISKTEVTNSSKQEQIKSSGITSSKNITSGSVEEPVQIPQTEESMKTRLFSRIKELADKVVKFYKKIIDKVKNIKYTICNLWDKLLHLKETIGFYYEVLTREESKRAISKLKTQLGRLLKHIKPKKVKGIIEFGFEDPATTGDLFGKVCMLYPIYGNNIVIIPHFEENLVKGEIALKGRIRVVTLLHIGWKIIFDKEIRTLYQTLTGGLSNE